MEEDLKACMQEEAGIRLQQAGPFGCSANFVGVWFGLLAICTEKGSADFSSCTNAPRTSSARSHVLYLFSLVRHVEQHSAVDLKCSKWVRVPTLRDAKMRLLTNSD